MYDASKIDVRPTLIELYEMAYGKRRNRKDEGEAYETRKTCDDGYYYEDNDDDDDADCFCD